MNSLVEKIIDWLKKSFGKLIQTNATPHQVAMGFSVGAFIGVFPTFGLGWIIAAGLSFLFKLNYTSTIIGSIVVMNPITWPFFYSLSAFTGAWIFNENPSTVLNIIQSKSLLGSIGRISFIYLIDNIIISLIVSVFCYFIIKKLITDYKKRKEIKSLWA
jgi:hypothetical protein